MESSTNAERLVASAIKFYTLDSDYPMIMCGKRHCDIYESMWRASLNYLKSTAIQGFLTDKDRSTAKRLHLKQSEIPANVVIISDMAFDRARGVGYGNSEDVSVMESIAKKFAAAGYTIPKLVFWNVDARNDVIPMRDNGMVTFVSGYSASLFEQLLTGKTGLDLVMEKLNNPRYASIH